MVVGLFLSAATRWDITKEKSRANRLLAEKAKVCRNISYGILIQLLIKSHSMVSPQSSILLNKTPALPCIWLRLFNSDRATPH